MFLLSSSAEPPGEKLSPAGQQAAAPAPLQKEPLQAPVPWLKAPVPAAAIKHWTVAEAPLPRDRKQFGIGEEVDLWVDKHLWKKPKGEVIWHIQGAGTIFPVVGKASRMTVALTDRDSPLVMEAFHLASTPAARVPQAGQELSTWLQQQRQEMKKRAWQPKNQAAPAQPSYGPKLRQLLQKLDTNRNGGSLIDMDQQVPNLLKEFTKPEERGQIYYAMAHAHAQSGLLFPEKVREYASKALELPLQPEQRFQLYVYWGDAHRVDRRSLPPSVKRKWSAQRYLEGLHQLLAYSLPDIAPGLPAVNKMGAHMPTGDPASETYIRQLIDYLKEKEAHDKAWAARRQAEFIGRLVWQRAVLRGQIVDQYHPDPAAWDELRQMANAILGNRAAVDRLMADVKSGKNAFSK
jgi:hypothetical protein